MSRGSFSRRYGTKKPHSAIRIYVEGTETEPQYFEAIRNELGRLTSRTRIFVKGCPRKTPSALVELICGEKESLKYSDEETDWWVVFDKDEWKDFDLAIKNASENEINVAYSNPSFEVWFLFHYECQENSIKNNELRIKLSKLLGRKYEKNMNMYSHIKDKEATAIRNAKKLEEMHKKAGTISSEKRNPSTTVHALVERLRNLG